MNKLTEHERESIIYSIGEYGDTSRVVGWEQIEPKLKIEYPRLAAAIANKAEADKRLEEELEVFANN
ncbi:hypothetical protein [Photorhabdus temperata]|uniref:Uncharacterized protein n=1 Tax=Photorhabdus temperata J3 TaxID=1389415 RepID=U7R7L3_PHOTE|nr:hypothetical protein [Photorhabdus temperata]EQB98102.1 hypothetical protein B738_26917 [Photorhabdus temperata subsp. temperata M1021]ERT14836.1 hypothetical protein O185_01510 [Photorhabdus temperata J3]